MTEPYKERLLFDTQVLRDDPKPLARRSDPIPSKLAAAQIVTRLGVYHRLFVRTLRKMNCATAQEIAASAFPVLSVHSLEVNSANLKKRETIRKRASALVSAGYIEKTQERICRETGKMASEFKVTLQGSIWVDDEC